MGTTPDISPDHMVCIERPEPALSAIFQDMYISQRLVDVTLKCMDGQLQAHKMVLAASSEYFSSIFDDLANPFHYPVIVLKDMRIDDLRLLVEFMYGGRLTLSQERLASLIKSAENLQILGLSEADDHLDGTPHQEGTGNNQHGNAREVSQQHSNRGKKFSLYRTTTLLQSSMITEGSAEESYGSNHFDSRMSLDPASTKNLNNHQLLVAPVTSMRHVQQHLSNIDHQQQLLYQKQQQLNNHLQVLSHSLAANKSSQKTKSSQPSAQAITHDGARGRVHPCNICWKNFTRKANLIRHLQVQHSLDRVSYSCPDCNKTFSSQENYVRHTKTLEHQNNARPQASSYRV